LLCLFFYGRLFRITAFKVIRFEVSFQLGFFWGD
jgi:hypothetical protein